MNASTGCEHEDLPEAAAAVSAGRTSLTGTPLSTWNTTGRKVAGTRFVKHDTYLLIDGVRK